MGHGLVSILSRLRCADRGWAEGEKLCQKRESAVINQKGGGLSSMWRVDLDTTVAPIKDVRRPVCTEEMLSFVIPTLFYSLESLVVFLSAGILLPGGLQCELCSLCRFFPVVTSPPPPFPFICCVLDLQFATATRRGPSAASSLPSRPPFPLSLSPLAHSLPLSQLLQILGLKGTFGAE